MSVVSNDRLKITSPAGVAAALPALVGFKPKESIVAVFLKEDRVIVCMRADIPDLWDEVAVQLEVVADRVDADALILTICCARGKGDLPFQDEVTLVLKDLASTRIVVNAAMLVDGAQYWPFDLQSKSVASDACNDEGVFLDLETSGLGTDGFAASREDVCARYAFRQELQPTEDLVAQASQSMSDDPKEIASVAWESVCILAGRNGIEHEGFDLERLRAILMVAVTHVHVRDYVMGRIATDTTPVPLVEVVVETALRAPLDLRPKIAGMAAALLAAFNPSTVPASCLVELAGSDSLADLVRRSIGGAMPPTEIRDLLARCLPQASAQLEGVHE